MSCWSRPIAPFSPQQGPDVPSTWSGSLDRQKRLTPPGGTMSVTRSEHRSSWPARHILGYSAGTSVDPFLPMTTTHCYACQPKAMCWPGHGRMDKVPDGRGWMDRMDGRGRMDAVATWGRPSVLSVRPRPSGPQRPSSCPQPGQHMVLPREA